MSAPQSVRYFLILYILSWGVMSQPLFAQFETLSTDYLQEQEAIPTLLYKAMESYVQQKDVDLSNINVFENKISIWDRMITDEYTYETSLSLEKKKLENGKEGFRLTFGGMTLKETDSFPTAKLKGKVVNILYDALTRYLPEPIPTETKDKATVTIVGDPNVFHWVALYDGNALIILKAIKIWENPKEDGSLPIEYDLVFVKQTLDAVSTSFDVELVGDHTQVHVGGALYNRIRDLRRTVYAVDNGPGKDSNLDKLLDIERYANVGPNTILVVNSSHSIQVGNVDKTGTGVSAYLWDAGTASVEAFLNIFTTFQLAFVGGVFQPFVEVGAPFLSSQNLSEKLIDDGQSLWDETKGIGYRLYEVGDKLGDGDVVRSANALAIHLPQNVMSFGLTAANKAIGLPSTLLSSAIDGTVEIFTDDKDRDHAAYVLTKKIVSNSDYDSTFKMKSGKEYTGRVSFEHGSIHTPEPFWGRRWEDHDGQWVDSCGYYFDNLLQTDLEASWMIAQSKTELIFLSKLNWEGQDVVLVGASEGNFDIDIEGVIISVEDANDLASKGSLNRRAARAKSLGTFHLDD
ncbi:MAG: hypothetical protein HY390_01125 [Deltaproteobacteria bacterium]|nr:hypothetical protein [Deltaproteobacteria bacterium]